MWCFEICDHKKGDTCEGVAFVLTAAKAYSDSLYAIT
ncbi:hypothetical protein EMIT0196MI5_10341 [Pseudomonas sp. IT-196MI5]